MQSCAFSCHCWGHTSNLICAQYYIAKTIAAGHFVLYLHYLFIFHVCLFREDGVPYPTSLPAYRLRNIEHTVCCMRFQCYCNVPFVAGTRHIVCRFPVVIFFSRVFAPETCSGILPDFVNPHSSCDGGLPIKLGVDAPLRILLISAARCSHCFVNAIAQPTLTDSGIAAPLRR